LQRGQRSEQLVDLEGAHQAQRNTPVRRQRCDVAPAQHDAAFAGRHHPGELVDQRGLAGAVGADQRVARTATYRQGHLVGRGDAAEAFDQVVGLEHHITLKQMWLCHFA
jgi:hypothetical protein